MKILCFVTFNIKIEFISCQPFQYKHYIIQTLIMLGHCDGRVFILVVICQSDWVVIDGVCIELTSCNKIAPHKWANNGYGISRWDARVGIDHGHSPRG